jgi:hypothetical protein
MNTDLIKQDIYDWVVDYIEANHEFYNYKFPPCPFAKSARLKGMMDIQVWEKGSYKKFVEHYATDMHNNTNYTVRILVFPHSLKYRFWMKKSVAKLNAKIASLDLYAQIGSAIKTTSKYPGILETGPYGIVIINRLSDILGGHQSLLRTDYYKSWSKEHYDAVVTRRQEIADTCTK